MTRRESSDASCHDAALGIVLSVIRILFWNDSYILNYNPLKTEIHGRSVTHFFTEVRERASPC
jgi:hypothetical protein